MDSYVFPSKTIKHEMDDPLRDPLILVCCGSFSPITYLHLRNFNEAADYCKFATNYEVIGGYLSPVSDSYNKPELASAEHRVNMCQMAIGKPSWMAVDPWEASQKEYQRTATVLDHFDHEINTVQGGYDRGDGIKQKVKISLLAGGDLLQTMVTPGIWSDEDLDHIFTNYECYVVGREGVEIDGVVINEVLAKLDRWRKHVHLVPQFMYDNVSSTKMRQLLREGRNVQYMMPDPVIEYIKHNGLYTDEAIASDPNQKSFVSLGGKARTNGITS